MPGAGRHRFGFEGRQPPIFVALVVLLFANTLVGLLLPRLLHYFVPAGFPGTPPCQELLSDRAQYHVPWAICWLESRFIAIQFILLACIAGVFLILRGRVRYIDVTRR